MSIPAVARNVIDLGRGHPTTRILNDLARQEFSQASKTVLEKSVSDSIADDDRHPFQYGTDQGPLSCRNALASCFTEKYHVAPIDPDTLAFTCGASYGFANTLLQLTDPSYTRRIFMITPAYFLAARMVQDAGYADKMFAIEELTSVADQDDQIVFDEKALLKILEQDAASSEFSSRAVMPGKRYRYVFYAVPTYSNPTGITWNEKSRLRLLAIARRYDVLILTDEVYDFLDYKAHTLSPFRPIKRIVDYDTATVKDDYGNTISNFSVSKYFGPGMRTGCIQSATKKLAITWAAGGANHSGGSTSQLTSFIVSTMIERSFDTILGRLVGIYGERSRALSDCVIQEFPRGTLVSGGQGGYFIWITLPLGYCVEELLERARDPNGPYGVLAISGASFEVPGKSNLKGWGSRSLRISISWLELDQCIEGIKRLGRVFEDHKAQIEQR